mmetsp:Transcript_18370/g.20920  ORF Transcript_18370/g.20920 Transcript_18370/m.20920 type:complete len:232 (-) Transcript_18370:377-1072(-)
MTSSVVGSPSSKDVTKEQGYWNSFYAKFKLKTPSQFCVLTATEASPEQSIVEFGCGNARDSLYLASQGFTVFACDLSQEAIDGDRLSLQKGGGRCEFAIVDASKRQDVEFIIEKARNESPGLGAPSDNKVTVYTRFFLHSIDAEQENLFLDALAAACNVGDQIYFEFRCSLDEVLPKVYGTSHYRRYIDTDALVMLLKTKGFDVPYHVTGRGMAKYKEEDPFVSRIIGTKI